MLNEKNIINYWKERTEKQKELTVGFSQHSKVEQDILYKEKNNFIFSKIDSNKRTIDYGCGIGRCSMYFNNKRYLGVDITEKLLDIAIKNNPNYNYKLLLNPFLTNLNFDFELFFTSTVLQHNDDNLVMKIFESLRDIKKNGFEIVLYENTNDSVNSNHMCFRKKDDYKNIVKLYFNINEYFYYDRIDHLEQHSLMIFKV